MLTPFQDRARRALEECPFFKDLPRESMHWVHRTALRRGQLLFEKDAPSDHLFALVSGQVKMFSPGEGNQEVALELIAPGELLGELGIAGELPRHASSIAMANSELATLRRRDLEPLLERHPALHGALARAAANAAARLTRRLEDAAFLSLEKRVEKTLRDLGTRFGQQVDQGTQIRLRQQDLADLLDLSRESVSKVLTSSAMRGKLALGRGSIVLLGA
jgi:CRP-like cAMP-binding protein